MQHLLLPFTKKNEFPSRNLFPAKKLQLPFYESFHLVESFLRNFIRASSLQLFSEKSLKKIIMEKVITLHSTLDFHQTLERVIQNIQKKGFKIFAQIDHAKEAKLAGFKLNPTQLIIFGNPAVGTFLMQDKQTCGIDLPAKILVWEDSQNSVMLSYHEMSTFSVVHHLSERSEEVLHKISETVQSICKEATQ